MQKFKAYRILISKLTLSIVIDKNQVNRLLIGALLVFLLLLVILVISIISGREDASAILNAHNKYVKAFTSCGPVEG